MCFFLSTDNGGTERGEKTIEAERNDGAVRAE